MFLWWANLKHSSLKDRHGDKSVVLLAIELVSCHTINDNINVNVIQDTSFFAPEGLQLAPAGLLVMLSRICLLK